MFILWGFLFVILFLFKFCCFIPQLFALFTLKFYFHKYVF